MTREPIDRRDSKAPALPSTSALGPADARTLEIAAEILRERTMSLEAVDHGPARRLVWTVVVVTALVAGGLLVFRNEVRSILGLA